MTNFTPTRNLLVSGIDLGGKMRSNGNFGRSEFALGSLNFGDRNQPIFQTKDESQLMGESVTKIERNVQYEAGGLLNDFERAMAVMTLRFEKETAPNISGGIFAVPFPSLFASATQIDPVVFIGDPD